MDHHALVLGIGLLGEQGLAETAFIVGDQVAGSTEDMFSGAVVALEPDDLGAGKSFSNRRMFSTSAPRQP
jgi:hypothetical protein